MAVVGADVPVKVDELSIVDFRDDTADVISMIFVAMGDVAVVFPLFDDVRTIGITIAATIPRMITTAAVNNIFFFFGFA